MEFNQFSEKLEGGQIFFENKRGEFSRILHAQMQQHIFEVYGVLQDTHFDFSDPKREKIFIRFEDKDITLRIPPFQHILDFTEFHLTGRFNKQGYAEIEGVLALPSTETHIYCAQEGWTEPSLVIEVQFSYCIPYQMHEAG